MTDQHTPTRPQWKCEGCGEDWPCQSARDALVAEYSDDRVALAVRLAGDLHTAAGEIAGATSSDLYRRFVQWTR